MFDAAAVTLCDVVKWIAQKPRREKEEEEKKLTTTINTYVENEAWQSGIVWQCQ